MSSRNIYTLSFLWISLFLSCCAQKTPAPTSISIEGDQWYINGSLVNQGSAAEGLLMNVRMVNAIFEDDSQKILEYDPDFDADQNTEKFIQSIPLYVEQGINAFTISLQGGLPGYEGAINSAYNADGSLRTEYLERADQVITAASKAGAAVILTCFYQRQHSHERALTGKDAIIDAVANVVAWIESQKYSNVLLEISNEYAHGGFKNWTDGEWLSSAAGQVELIEYAQSLNPDLYVSTSGMGNGLIPESIARVSDFILIHFNNTALVDIPEKVKLASVYGKPVVCNEDDKIGLTGAEAAKLSVLAGAGWGLMQSGQNQDAPFRFEGAADDSLVYEMISKLTTPGVEIDQSQSTEMSVLITEPKDGDIYATDETITIKAALSGLEAFSDLEVHFRNGKQLLGKSETDPWTFNWENIPAGKYEIEAMVRDQEGQEVVRSRKVDIEVR